MNKIKLFILAVLSSAIFSGCLQVNTKVNLNQDGSGTIEETFLMKNSVIDMMKEFVMAFDSTKGEDFNMFNEKELKAKEANYGEDVKYVSGEKVSNNDYEGFKAIYSFKDINNVKLNPSPEDQVPFGDELDETQKKSADDILKFEFKKGNPSTLVINFPKPQLENESKPKEDSTEIQDSVTSEADMQKLIDMFDGMKISLSFNFDRAIKETNAVYVNGSEVTLMEIDFAEIIKHKDILEKLQKSKPQTIEQFKEVVGELPGIKVEFKDKITIKF